MSHGLYGRHPSFVYPAVRYGYGGVPSSGGGVRMEADNVCGMTIVSALAASGIKRSIERHDAIAHIFDMGIV